MINKRYNEELKFELINDKQFSKYKIIKNNAILTVNKQKTFLGDMKLYNNMCGGRFEADVVSKKKKFNELEFQVFTIKSDTVKLQKKLDLIKDNILIITKNIKDTKNKNICIVQANNILLRIFFKTKINLLKIHKNFKIKSLGEIIHKFNDQKLVYQSLYSQFLNLNKIIAELNMVYTRHIDELKVINSKIEVKEYEESKLNLTDDLITKSEVDLKEMSSYNKSLKEKAVTQEKFLNNIHIYLSLYDVKISEVISNNFFSFNTDKSPLKKNTILEIKPSTFIVNSPSKQRLSSILPTKEEESEWNINKIKLLIQFFLKFGFKLLYITSLVCSSISLDLHAANSKLTDESIEQLENNMMDESQSNHSNNNMQIDHSNRVVEIYNIFKDNILTTLDEYIIQAMSRLENKIKILSRTERDIFKDRRKENDNSIKEINTRRKTSMENIFDNFAGFLKKEGNKGKVSFLKNIQSQMIFQMQKYTNELVKTDKEEQINRRSTILKNKQNEDKIKEFKEYKEIKEQKAKNNKLINHVKNNKQKSSIPLNIPKTSIVALDTKNSIIDDSYISNDGELKTEDKNVTVSNGMQKKNKETAKFYQRMDDLRNLDLKYFKEGEKKKFNNEEFNEIYYQFKKKYNVKNSPRGNIKISAEKMRRKMGKTTSTFTATKINFSSEKKKRRLESVAFSNALSLKDINDNEKFINTAKSRRTSSYGMHSTGFTYKPNRGVSNVSENDKIPDTNKNIRSFNTFNSSNAFNEKNTNNIETLSKLFNFNILELPSLKANNISLFSQTNYYTNTKLNKKK